MRALPTLADTDTMALDIHTRKKLKALGHGLNPVVMVAGKGLSDTVLDEVRRGLHDHELIKVRFSVGDRAVKQQLIAEMCASCQCELVQQIGHIALVYKENAEAKPNLSNVRSWGD
ncbi:MAG TPA: YhbY family RNA-binding protein [Pseudomonadales bacterium]|nr:YhbY family RNA-binding protein [Pseudomonadales bacterium]